MWIQIGDLEAAVSAFEMAQSLRPFDPYSVACTGISLVHLGLSLQARGEDDAGEGKLEQGLNELTSAVVVVSRTAAGDELAIPDPSTAMVPSLQEMMIPSYAYDPFFLRGEYPAYYRSPSHR